MRDDRRLLAAVHHLWTHWHRRFHRLLVSLLILAVSVDARVHVTPIGHVSDTPTVLVVPLSVLQALRPWME